MENKDVTQSFKRYCKKWNRVVTVTESADSPALYTCVDLIGGEKCAKAQCRYSWAMAMAAMLQKSMLGELYTEPNNPDYTIDLRKECDICSKMVSCDACYLVHTDTVLASDAYVDSVVNNWVGEGLLPAQLIAGGITNEIRAVARRDIARQSGATPWFVCEACLPKFSLRDKEKAEAKKRALNARLGKKTEGVRAKHR